MDPRLATFLTIAFILYLFRWESRQVSKVTGAVVSGAVWIPILWFLIIATRAVSTWMGMFGLGGGGGTLEGGSTPDAIGYFVLIIAGALVLSRRRVSIGAVIGNNRWLCIYLLFCLTAILWSDFPFVAFKRWAKELGHPIMVLILLTEDNVQAALTSFFKRCAYVIVPVSILFIKYYPAWGRGFDAWSGYAFNTGITENKNSLGWDCLILALFFIWHLMGVYRLEKSKPRRNEIILCVSFISMIWWLLSIAESKTPLICLTLALVLLLFTGVKSVNKRLVGVYVVAAGAVLYFVNATTDVYEGILELIGRNATLTTRTFLWAELWKWDSNPILGTGFESFWLGERRLVIWKALGWNASEAHNGYFETYLNLGVVGFLFMMGLLYVAYRKSRMSLINGSGFGRFQFAFLFAFMLYNWTESAMGGLHPVWFTFFVVIMEYPVAPAPQKFPVRSRSESSRQSSKLRSVPVGR